MLLAWPGTGSNTFLSLSILGQILKVRELPDLKVFLLTLKFFACFFETSLNSVVPRRNLHPTITATESRLGTLAWDSLLQLKPEGQGP